MYVFSSFFFSKKNVMRYFIYQVLDSQEVSLIMGKILGVVYGW